MCTGCAPAKAVQVALKQLPNDKWQVRWREPNGDQRARTFKLKADALAFEQAIATDMRRGAYVPISRGNQLLADWADTWLKGALNLSQGTIDTYRRDLDRHILPALGKYKVRQLTAERIEEYLTGELEAKVAPSSVHRHYRTLHRCLHVAVQRQVIPANPCDPVHPPRVPRTEMMFLTGDQVEALATSITTRYRAWVLVAAYAGVRWSEAVGLRRRDLDGPRLTIVEQLVRRANGDWDRTEPKTRAGRRVITLPDTVAEVLEEHVARWSQGSADGLVFPNQGGRPMNGPSFRQSVFLPAVIKAGIATPIVVPGTDEIERYENVPRIHDLRHTAAALMVAAGAHPKAMQVRMGHSSITVTLDRYGHLFPEMDAALAAALDDLRPRHLKIVA